jgi:hypothetical protein
MYKFLMLGGDVLVLSQDAHGARTKSLFRGAATATIHLERSVQTSTVGGEERETPGGMLSAVTSHGFPALNDCIVSYGSAVLEYGGSRWFSGHLHTQRGTNLEHKTLIFINNLRIKSSTRSRIFVSCYFCVKSLHLHLH